MCEIAPTKPILIKDFSNVCRTCLGGENVFPIFELIIDNIKGTDLLEYSINLKTDRGDNLPKNICETCLKELCKIYKFKRQCHNNDLALKQIEENSKYDQEITVVDLINVANEECDPLSETNEIPEVDSSDPIASEGLYQCPNCREGFETPDEFRLHRYIVHKCKRLRPCEHCNKVFKANYLRQHMKLHTKETGEKRYICSLCGKGFMQKRSLQVHKKKFHQSSNNSSFNCEECGRAFKRLAWYNIHLKKHDLGKERYELPIADSIREYVCEICARAHQTKQQLRAHMFIHREKKFVCLDCGKGFVVKSLLQSHMRTHTGERPYKCTLCDKSFAQIGHLAAHTLTHRKKSYACSQCPMAFRMRVDLMHHLKKHSGDKPHACKFCGKTFMIKRTLKEHERRHTGETPYVCQVCNNSFYSSYMLKVHVKKHAREENGAVHH